MRYIFPLIISLLFGCLSMVKAQAASDEIIFKAMNDEMARSITKLKFNEFKPPFFMAYYLNDSKTFYIRASLGSVIQSQETPNRSNSLRLMVGDYSLNDENFAGGNSSYFSGGSLPVPLENDYNALRQSFWAMTDVTYKSSIETYEQKLTALKQQNSTDTIKLDDFSRTRPVQLILNQPSVTYSKIYWENTAKELSAIFKNYGHISSSSVQIVFTQSSFYMTNNEGSKVKSPSAMAYISVTANTQAEDGDYLRDQLYYAAPTLDLLPRIDKIKQDIKELIERMGDARKAPMVDDSYSGLVVFEGDAAAEFFKQRLFNYNGLFTSREPVYAVDRYGRGGANGFESKINQRILSQNVTIKEMPNLKTFNGVPLVGSFEVDGEGVVPKDELVLVDKGILKTLLSDRVPTPKVRQSNGYLRASLSSANTIKAPGVVNITFADGLPYDTLVTRVRQQAADNGQEYFYIIRKIEYGRFNPLTIYKVSVRTGVQQLMRSAQITDFSNTALKHIIFGTPEQVVYNTRMNDVPVSFIVPRAIVFDDVNIEKEKGTNPKLPVVPNPVAIENK